MDLFDLSDEMLEKPQPEQHLEGLNDVQKQAVLQLQGPVLILAGAGTGKTKVLTSKLAHILLTGAAYPSQILAVTFTNKAANEMKERAAQLVQQNVEGWWLGTFHSLSARMLRRHAELIKRSSNFIIIDTDDSQRLIKQLMGEFFIDEKKYPPRIISAKIQRWKDKALHPHQVTDTDGAQMASGAIVRLYERYQQRLQQLDAVDFGDLLLLCIEMLQQNPDILSIWQQRFHYILVDEYQDTNIAQYLWLRLLAKGHGNISCVGDDDQSIYSWRGAEVGNILRFEKDFEHAHIFRLEQNYRSTGHILGAASSIIAHNTGRYDKQLWTDGDMGEKVELVTVRDSDEEASMICVAINNLHKNGESWDSCAILVRTSFQMRNFEEQLFARAIPYRVVGGARFYERKEIRDAIAYLRLLITQRDDLAFERIINVPKRGIGPASLEKLYAYARQHDHSLMHATGELLAAGIFSGKAKSNLQNFTENYKRWTKLLSEKSHDEVAEIVLEESGYLEMYRQDKSVDAQGRIENLKELIAAISEYENLAEFLDHVALVMENEKNASGDQVTLMTLHGAKGLEFDNVFLPGWEEGLFPNQRAIDETGNQGLEEERRLAYVAITRGKRRVLIFNAAVRMMFGRLQNAMPSRFLDELPEEHINRKSLGLASHSHSPTQYKRHNFAQKKDKFIESNDDEWGIGVKVYHRVFGEGTIEKREGERLSVKFNDGQIKKVMRSFLQLV